MTVNVGVIGVGMIGQDHIRRLTHVLSGARVSAVTDADLERAKSVADSLSGATVHKTGQDLIEDPDVDAVVVASWGPTHEEFVLAGIAAGKQVFCEKPLATTREACERILDAEVAAGRAWYGRLHAPLRRGLPGDEGAAHAGAIGAPLIYYSGHRNPSVPPLHHRRPSSTPASTTSTSPAGCWTPRSSPRRSSAPAAPRRGGPAGPAAADARHVERRVVNVEAASTSPTATTSGARCSARPARSSWPRARGRGKREGQFGGRVPADWRERFIRAYDIEFQEWLDAVAAGIRPARAPGTATRPPSSAMPPRGVPHGRAGPVTMRDKPDLYLAGSGDGAGAIGTD